jgi:hypothetical protein
MNSSHGIDDHHDRAKPLASHAVHAMGRQAPGGLHRVRKRREALGPYDGQQRWHVTAESGRVPATIVDIVAGMAIARSPVTVIDAAEAAVIDLGATKHPHQPGTSFRVFLDPAGHPFCLCLN